MKLYDRKLNGTSQLSPSGSSECLERLQEVFRHCRCIHRNTYPFFFCYEPPSDGLRFRIVYLKWCHVCLFFYCACRVAWQPAFWDSPEEFLFDAIFNHRSIRQQANGNHFVSHHFFFEKSSIPPLESDKLLKIHSQIRKFGGGFSVRLQLLNGPPSFISVSAVTLAI